MLDEPPLPKLPRGAAGKRCYAIGDVHGCADELSALLQLILDDHRSLPEKQTAIVFLGDLIDRGPDSRGVVEQIMAFKEPGIAVHVIGGNHEEMFLKGLLRDPSIFPQWLRYGGYAFCESYGIPADELMGLDPDSIRSRIIRHVPESHVAFLSRTIERVRFGDYLLVHAGINPAVPLDQQEGHDLRWIRDAFLNSTEDFGCVVVHGHTVFNEVDRRPNRIGIDTGAYETGMLTAIRLEETDQVVLATAKRLISDTYAD